METRKDARMNNLLANSDGLSIDFSHLLNSVYQELECIGVLRKVAMDSDGKATKYVVVQDHRAISDSSPGDFIDMHAIQAEKYETMDFLVRLGVFKEV